MNKGLIVEIYRNAHYMQPLNKLNRFKSVTLIDSSIEGPFTPDEERPQIRLVRRTLFGKDYIHAEPLEPGVYQFGGSFIYTSDSRFTLVNKYPIPLHDRQE